MPARLRSVDRLRGIAVVMMIASHVCDAFLSDAWRNGIRWHASNISFGFVGPAFLMLAGVTLGLQMTKSREPKGQESGAVGWKIARRLVVILLLGYWLQIPVPSLYHLVVESTPEELRRLFDANILHAIALSSATILLLATLLRSPALTRIATAAIAVAVLVVTPWIWDAEIYRDLWLPVRAFVAPQPVAMFPLLPYAFHLLIGFLLAPLCLAEGNTLRRGAMLTAAGVFLLIAGPLLHDALGGIPPHDDFWGPGIGHTLMRAGGVIAALGAALLFEHRGSERVSMLEGIGRRSLAIYIVHLVLVYGSPITMGMRYWFDGMLDRAFAPVSALLIIASITTLCYHAVRVWEWIRAEHPQIAWWMMALWWGRFALLFLG